MSSIAARLLLALLGAAISVASGTLSLVSAGVVPFNDAWVPGLTLRFAPMDEGWIVATVWIAVSALVALAGLLLAVSAVRHPKKKPGEFLVDEDALYGGGRVHLAARALEAAVVRASLECEGVVAAHASLRMRRAGWSVRMNLEADPQYELPEVSRLVQEHVRAALQRLTGITVDQLDVWLSPATLVARPLR